MEIVVADVVGDGVFKLDVQRHLIETGLAILGRRGSGKSYLVGKICEELCEVKQPFIIIDDRGEYYTLRERYPVVIISLGTPKHYTPDIANVTPEMSKAIVKATLETNQSLIIDLKPATMLEKFRFLAEFLPILYKEAERQMKPYVLIMDEAHRLTPEKSMIRLREVREYQNKVIYWVYEIAATGRHLGLGFISVARRPAEISKSILTQCELRIWFKVSGVDLERLKEEVSSELAEKVKGFSSGTAVVTGLDESLIIKIHKRKCTHGGETPLAKPVAIPRIDNFKQTLQKVLEEIKAKAPPPKVPKTVLTELKEKTELIRRLEEENMQLKAKISEYKSTCEILENKLKNLLKQFEELKKQTISIEEIEDLKLTIATLKEENAQLRSRIKDLEEQLIEASKTEEKFQELREFLLNLRDFIIDVQKFMPELELIPSDIIKLKEERDYYKEQYERYKRTEDLEKQAVKEALEDSAVQNWIRHAKSILGDLKAKPTLGKLMKIALTYDPEISFLPEEIDVGVTVETNRRYLKMLALKGLLWETSKQGRKAFRNRFHQWITENIRRIKPTAPDKAIEIIHDQLREHLLR
ncbi:MAG: hypothetical protein DRJ30_07025 [Candidatus Methanomethylicota archaeon]|nr:MAG: hypothetical protein DRJ30_07025 [Candidatus Verstraetearchaeota archaeon]